MKGNNTKEGISSKKCIEIIRALQSQHPDKSISRDFFRHHANVKESEWSLHFGSFGEFKRQAGLQLTRGQKKILSNTAKHASLDQYSDFFVRKVLPWHNRFPLQEKEQKEIKKLMICSDLHDIHIDRFAWSVFLDQCRLIKPDHIILAGDIYDLPEFSNWSKDPRDFKIKERYDFVRKHIFGALREVCPDSQIDLIIGNHEYRLLRVLTDATPNLKVLLSDVLGLGLEDLFMLKEHKINLTAKLDLRADTKSGIEDQLAQNYKIFYDCFAVTHKKNYGFGISGCSGHHHKMHMDTSTNIPSKQMSWVSMSGMHKLDAEYYEGMNNWNLGYNEVTLNTRTSTVLQVPRMIHEDWAAVNGVYYAKNEGHDRD